MLKWDLPKYNLENRFFIRLLYLVILTSVISIIGNIIIRLPSYSNYKWFAAIFISCFAIRHALQSKYIALWKNVVFFIIIYILLPSGWLIYGVYNYLIMSYASLICVSICFLLEKKQRVFFLVSEFLVITTLFILSEKIPLIFKSTNHPIYTLDLAIQIPLTFCAMVYICMTYSNAWRKEHQLLEKFSKEDDLTGVYNRRFIFQYLDQLKCQNKDVQIAMLDMDNFKAINDELGHIEGDKVIYQVCQDLQQIFKSHGVVGRYGGDEFIIIVENLELDECITKLEQLRSILKHSPSYKNHPITFSCGLATFKSDSSIDDALSHADQLLYTIKNSGKDGIASKTS